MQNLFRLLLLFSLLSCIHRDPPSEAAIAAGMITHAGVHKDFRKKGKIYTSSEENVAKINGDFVASAWDTYQKGKKVASLKEAERILNESHTQIKKRCQKKRCQVPFSRFP